ncbi:hypothetical protein ABKV19_026979, partial [Rosa sericea]
SALDAVQLEISNYGQTEDRLDRETSALNGYRDALALQDCLLREKARLRWLQDGDRNTSFLHNMIKLRQLKNSITSLRVGQQLLHDHGLIADHAVQHFSSSFTRDCNIVNTGLVERLIPHLVTDGENQLLTALPSAEEVKSTVFSMDGSSAPGPDGFGGCFFQFCWDVISTDVIS